MANISIEYCNTKGYKAYDGTELKEGQVLAPILFSEEMIANNNTVSVRISGPGHTMEQSSK